MTLTDANRTPALQANVYLVRHGYQIDIIDTTCATPDGNGVITQTMCRDFAGDYDEAIVASELTSAFLDTIKNLERNRLKDL